MTDFPVLSKKYHRTNIIGYYTETQKRYRDSELGF
jgi:hypothetical protein